jgi:hypothetical protein
MLLELDPEQHYKSAMDSVNLILENNRPDYTSDEEWAATIARNKEHLQIMLDKDFWTTEDLTPFRNAINFNSINS